ncbi:MAG TPA: hypothetical protein HPP94_17290 [Desulfuromonadales bacterium]|nr:hypothetical protein [Desulfuromonadales bacterium]
MKQINKDQALAAIRNGEFGEDIIRSAEKVTVILTQSWCPQWHAMQQFVGDILTADVWLLEYDRVDYCDAFREFKETKLRNNQIPYIRYYSDGILVAQSNAVTRELFQLYLEKLP